jgi:signal transduction histidine kinase
MNGAYYSAAHPRTDGGVQMTANVPESYFGISKKDLAFTVFTLGLIFIAIAVLLSDPGKPGFDTDTFQKVFLSTLSLAVLSALVFACLYAYSSVRNSSFLFIGLCWLANLIYIICGMVEVTEQQRFVTFVVALTADVPLLLSTFSEQQRRWWTPLPPIVVIAFSCAFYFMAADLPLITKLNVLYIIGPLSSALFLLWTAYALRFRQVLDPAIKYVRSYSLTFVSFALLQIPFSYQSACYFLPSVPLCGNIGTILLVSKAGLLVGKVANLWIVFYIIRDRLIGLHKLQQSTEQKLRVKGEFEELGYFAASLEHELRNPLEVLSDELDVLKKRTQSDPKLQERFTILEQQLNRISIAANIINVLRSKREDITPKMRPLSVVASVNQAIKDVKREFAAETANIFFQVGDRSNQSSIEAVPQLIEQCLVNIFKNSIEAINRGGKSGEIIADVSLKDRETVMISIRDNGDGFINEDIPNLTDPGYTRKEKSTRKSNRGLGLFVSERIVQLHEGNISFANNNDGGAVVKLEFSRYMSRKIQKAGLHTSKEPISDMGEVKR